MDLHEVQVLRSRERRRLVELGRGDLVKRLPPIRNLDLLRLRDRERAALLRLGRPDLAERLQTIEVKSAPKDSGQLSLLEMQLSLDDLEARHG